MSTNLTLTRGDHKTLEVTCKRGGVAVNITGAKMWLYAKNSPSDLDASAVITLDSTTGGIVLTSPTTGKARAYITPAMTSGFTETRTLFWDWQVKEADATVSTVASGMMTVNADIVRTTT